MSMKVKEALAILETLTEQGFIEFRVEDLKPEETGFLFALSTLGITDTPRKVGGSFGATLLSLLRAEALKRILRLMVNEPVRG